MSPATADLLKVTHLLTLIVLDLLLVHLIVLNSLALFLFFKRENFLRFFIVLTLVHHYFLVLSLLVKLHLGTSVFLLLLSLILLPLLLTDVVISLTKSIRGSVSMICNVLCHLNCVSSIRPLRSMSRMSQRLTLLNLLIYMSKRIGHQRRILLLIERGHSESLVGQSLILSTRWSSLFG